MSNKQTTAVQWLIEQTRTPEWHSLKRGDIIEQAKAIERKQIEDAYHKGAIDIAEAYNEGLSKKGISHPPLDKENKLDAERYFTSTFITE